MAGVLRITETHLRLLNSFQADFEASLGDGATEEGSCIDCQMF